jgi:ABC-type polysaccharide/polyol phosphate export permease
MFSIKKDKQRTVIEILDTVPWQAWPQHVFSQSKVRLHELWSYRELVHNLVIRDLKVRYKNSALGVLWSLLNPLMMMLVFTAVFTVMQGAPVEKFPVFVLVGLLPWQFFADSVSGGTASIVGNSHLINKVYFPREILTISGVLSNLVNFLLALLMLIPILYLFNIPLTAWALLLPLMILIQLMFTLGVSLIVATANVFYRDVHMIISVALLAGFFLTPVFYPLSQLPESYMLFGVELNVWRLMYYLNPMASIIENYRRILFYSSPHALNFIFRTFITSLGFLVIGLIVFYRYHNRFGEEI